jgi:hypothetical protein
LVVAFQVPSYCFGWLLLRKCRDVVVAFLMVGRLLLFCCCGWLVVAFQVRCCGWLVVASQLPSQVLFHGAVVLGSCCWWALKRGCAVFLLLLFVFLFVRFCLEHSMNGCIVFGWIMVRHRHEMALSSSALLWWQRKLDCCWLLLWSLSWRHHVHVLSTTVDLANSQCNYTVLLRQPGKGRQL